MRSQVRDVFEEYHFMPECDMDEQHKVLVQLAHIAHVGNYRNAELAGKQTHSQEFANAGNSNCIHLNETGASCLQVILEHDAIGNVFSKRDLNRGDGAG